MGKRCVKCGMPNTRPGLEFNEEGVCHACLAYEKQKTTDWGARWKELEILCDKYRGKQTYDCIVTVSGGKDSHYQVHIMKEKLGMNPLLVTVTDNYTHTKAGESNFKNLLERFGCHCIVFNPDKKKDREITRKMFEEHGKPTWYIDRYIYSFPLHIAKNFNIPLIVYGEDISYTYGGVNSIEKYSAKDQINNAVASDFSELTKPDPLLQAPKGLDSLEPIYLSYFVPWNSWNNFVTATTLGFKDLTGEWERSNHVENFDQIDSVGYLFHAWMKYPKFGHAAATDYACRFVRYGMTPKAKAMKMIEQHDHDLDDTIRDDFLNFTGYSEAEFYSILDKWYNKDLFEKVDGIWKLKGED